MKYFGLGVLVYIAVFGWIAYKVQAYETRLDRLESNKIEDQLTDSKTIDIWSEIQSWRTSEGKQEYVVDPILCKYARIRLNEIQSDWSHAGFWDHAYKILYEGDYVRIAENLARDWNDYSPLDAWLASPAHRMNLEDVYTNSCLIGEDGDYVQLFAI